VPCPGDPWLNIMGGIFTDKIIVQHLTGFRWMAISSTEEDIQIYDNARVLVALRKCLKKLEKYYLKTADIPDFVPDESHPRYFPYSTSFSEAGTMFHFWYLTSLENHPACVTYLAEITRSESTTDGGNKVAKTDGRVKVVVKFVMRYGEDVHKFLAIGGWAPNLRYCSPLCKTGLHNDSTTRLFQSAPPGLHSNVMRMVVMDYVDAQSNPPPDAHHQVKEVLDRLHLKGYVHGDLREPNILFEGNKVKLVDFDWCGWYDTGQADENIGDSTYAYYPLRISRAVDMYHADAKPLTPILPAHDLEMVKKF
jgi:serine/threonine protein kinase